MINEMEVELPEGARREIEKARLVEKDGKKMLELKFHERVPQRVRNIRMALIAANLIKDADEGGEEEENEPFRELLEGLTIKEWED